MAFSGGAAFISFARLGARCVFKVWRYTSKVSELMRSSASAALVARITAKPLSSRTLVRLNREGALAHGASR